VRQHHKAITMEDFFNRLAERVWPPGKRLAFCYTARRGPEPESCNAKDGNPFGPFWDAFGVTFDDSVAYGPLSYDVHHQGASEDWRHHFPADEYPVLAFTGAPASFPVQEDNLPLQKFLVFNAFWEALARNWVRQNMPPGPFIGVHLRNGLDWSRACEHTATTEQLFSSPQCLGYRGEHGRLTAELCAPGDKLIVSQLAAAVRQYGALSVYVASDNDHMVDFLAGGLGREGLAQVRLLRQAGLEKTRV
jgi:peptide-O-fucosyltransferase